MLRVSQKFYHENTAIVAMVSSSVFVMVLSDVWVPILFYTILDLIHYYNHILEVGLWDVMCVKEQLYHTVGRSM